eukprot:CAMPEP_0172090310 /NCGR_PEP_ID=MMETSP1043-20130122/24295_1 /TAXON_ID=464988 /ORGANISM="Hemiselmis andersenii, Strain CCMP441" /LENGTH=269 /DNA_ID=CAMNT_0012752865 /DNA_START=434 /DNA_END=1244 /DNA_ORIENTATION=+
MPRSMSPDPTATSSASFGAVIERFWTPREGGVARGWAEGARAVPETPKSMFIVGRAAFCVRFGERLDPEGDLIALMRRRLCETGKTLVTGADRGQINKSDEVEEVMEARLREARERAQSENLGWRSEYDPTGKLKEGDRDPISGRLILDPLKVPTSDQGAPASFAEYMERRAKQQGGQVLDAAGNDVTDIRPTAPTHQGSWGPTSKGGKDSTDDFLGLGAKDIGAPALTPEQEEWNKKRAEEEAAREAEAEARMQKWMAEAAAKKAQGQ